ncbi:MAG: hypothetical protein ACPG7F_10400 [Aggregatilineales bacterium]
MSKKKKQLSGKHLAVYPRKRSAHIMSLIGMLFVFLFLTDENIFAYAALNTGINCVSVALISMFLYLLYESITTIFFDRLIITKDGLIWWHSGGKHQVAWESIESFYQKSNGKFGRIWGVKTQDHVFAPLDYYLKINRISRYEMDRDAFRRSEPGKYFVKYVPQLFPKKNI